jgi:ABC-type transport system involved in cytochrome c biogenesis permease component
VNRLMEDELSHNQFTNFFNDAWEVLLKDLRLELRRKYEIYSIIILAFISNLSFGFSLGPSNPNVTDFISGMLWVSILFIGILGFTTGFVREMDRKTIEGLRVAPISPQAILAGKTVYIFLLMCGGAIIIIPSSMAILNYTFHSYGFLVLLVFALGILNIAVIGSIVSALAMYSQSRALIIPALSMPLLPGTIIPSILATGKLTIGADLNTILPELQINLGFLLLMIATLWITFEYVLYD